MVWRSKLMVETVHLVPRRAMAHHQRREISDRLIGVYPLEDELGAFVEAAFLANIR